MVRMNGAQAIVRLLEREELALVFGVAGGKLAPLLHAISKAPAIKYIGVRHEAHGAMAAAGAFAASGRPALAIGEMGPGGLNLASGTGVAFNNNLAALLLTTNQHRAAAYPHSGMFMDLDAQAVFRPITKWSVVAQDPRRIPDIVRTAFRKMLSGRPGPVHIDIPQDVLAAECDFADDEFTLTPQAYRSFAKPRASAADNEAAAAMLRGAARPLIVAGGGVVASGAQDELRRLARVLRAPVVPSQMALGLIPTDDAGFIGHGGIIGGDVIPQAFAQADVILAVGCRFSSWMWDERGPLARGDHKLVNINIDPEALGAATTHDVALNADAKLALADLLAALEISPAGGVDQSWLSGLRQKRVAYEDKLADLARGREAVMHPAALARAIADALPQDALAVYDGGHTTFWSNDFTPARAPRTRFHDPGMSHLGFGLPYALALQLLHPGAPVINITGDGSFGFSLQELDTARRYNLPVITLIHNNAAWGIIRAGQKGQFGFELGSSLADTDYAAIARGFGCFGETVTQPEEVAPAVARARASGLPAVIDCHTRFEPHPSMPLFGRMNRYGFDSLARRREL